MGMIMGMMMKPFVAVSQFVSNTWSSLVTYTPPPYGYSFVNLGNVIYKTGGDLAVSPNYNPVFSAYNVSTSSSVSVAAMITPRTLSTIITVGSDIYFIGGSTVTAFEMMPGMGFMVSPADSLACESYNVNSNTWTAHTNCPVSLSGRKAVLVGTKIYFPTLSGTSYTYDTVAGTWGTTLACTFSFGAQVGLYIVNFQSVQVIGTKIYCLGAYTLYRYPISYDYLGNVNGWGLGTNPVSNYMYDTVANTWTLLSVGNVSRDGTSSVAVGTKIYCFGGQSHFFSLRAVDAFLNEYLSNTVNVVEVYDTVNDIWTTLTPLPIDETFISLSVNGENIYLFGGYRYTQPPYYTYLISNNYYKYNITTNTFTSLPNAPTDIPVDTSLYTGTAYPQSFKIGTSIYYTGINVLEAYHI